MAQGTLWLQPIQHIFSAATVVPGAKAYFYLAGSTTPVNVYSDVGLTTAYTQPVTADANGVFAEIFLTPGTAYKVDVQTSAGVSLTGYPADNQLAIPASSANVAQSGTAGEAITAGQAVYLSDGSGGKNPAQWYKGDSTNGYSSSLAEVVGIAPASVAAGATGSFVTGGQVTGLSLTPGTDYFIGASGALTATAPANARYLGRADSVSSIVLAPQPGLLVSPVIKTSVVTPASAGLGYGVCGGRLTLTAGTPVTQNDVTGATTIYFSPYDSCGASIGNIGLYDGSANWTVLPFAEISVALGTLTAGLPYDIFAYNNSGSVALRAPVAWTSTTARATALTLQNGVLVKTGATTDRYLGTFYTSSTTQTADADATRYLWNYYNRVQRRMKRFETTTSWTYTTATWHQANAAAANQLDFVIGWDEVSVDASVAALGGNGGNINIWVAIGLDSTSAPSADCQVIPALTNTASTGVTTRYVGRPGIGRHTLVWLEASAASGTTTWYANNGFTLNNASGLLGWILG